MPSVPGRQGIRHSNASGQEVFFLKFGRSDKKRFNTLALKCLLILRYTIVLPHQVAEQQSSERHFSLWTSRACRATGTSCPELRHWLQQKSKKKIILGTFMNGCRGVDS